MTKIAKEKRILHIADKDRHTRALKDDAGNMIIEGYAAVFEQRSRLIFEGGEIFHEIIERGAFDEALASQELDVVYTYQHDTGRPMARLNPSRNIKSLELSTDDYGLKYRATLNNTQLSRDTYAMVEAGDLDEGSFIFSIDARGEAWERGKDGTPLRRVKKVRGLYDVSTVVNGAYANTDLAVASRSLQEYREEKKKKKEEEEEEKPPRDNYFDTMYEEIMGLESN
jgi:HK97 family phage prohead protease